MVKLCAAAIERPFACGVTHDLAAEIFPSYLPEGFGQASKENLTAHFPKFAPPERSDLKVGVAHRSPAKTFLRLESATARTGQVAQDVADLDESQQV